MADEQDELELTDDEFLVWCGEHEVAGCGKVRMMVIDGEDIREVSTCEDCRAKAQLAKVQQKRLDGPEIVCLCGSTRFVDTFNEWRRRLTLEGKIVLGIELVIPQSEREDPQHSNYKVKQALDELHLRKIDLADEVMVLNVGGYIGESTSREIDYAMKLGKPIKFLEAVDG